MSIKKPALFNQRGDTIVEVMIVLAILGLAISISYATANRSLLNTRQALENSQATELVQAQIEALRSMACSTGNPNCVENPAIFSAATAYCINTSVNPYVVVPISNVNDPSGYPPVCSQPPIPYSISIQYVNTPPANPDTFTVTALWPDVLGSGQNSVTLTYRLHHE